MLGFLSFEISWQHSVTGVVWGVGEGVGGGGGDTILYFSAPDLVAYCFHVVYSLRSCPCVGGAAAVCGMSGDMSVFYSCIKQAGG